MRILLVATRYPPYIGGLETHVYEVSRRLAAAGADITVLSTDTSGKLPPDETVDGVRLIRVPAWPRERDYFVAPDIYRVVSQGTWDLVHCQGIHNVVPPLAMLGARSANRPYIVSFHSGADTTVIRRALRFAHWQLLRPLVNKAHRCIAVSEFEALFFSKQLHVPLERFSVIPNGANHLAATVNAVGRPSNSRLIVSVGRLVRYKGHHRAIEAMPGVLRQFPDARLLIIGVGPYETDLRRLVARLGLSDIVDIRSVPPGDADAMARILHSSTLVVALSEWEGQGLAALEAIACGRPVLVTGSTALQELADKGLARAISPSSGPSEVAEAIVDQLRNPLLPPAIRLPTWDDCAMQLMHVYSQTIKEATGDVKENARVF